MIDNNKKEAAIKTKIITLTKIIMQLEKCNEQNAYKRLATTHLYELILNKNTGLYLEPIEFIVKAYEIERTKSIDEMVQFISNDI